MMDLNLTEPLTDEEKDKMQSLILRTLSEYDSDEVSIHLSNEEVSFDIVVSLKNFVEKEKENK